MTVALTDRQREALVRLAEYVGPETYLAGGVAVALHLHHRQSRDLDLFTPTTDPAQYAEAIATSGAPMRIISQAEGTLHLEVAGVPASWLRYRYPLLSVLDRVEGVPIPVASIDDLACMKLAAIAGRGAARDFWDLHEILTRKNVTLAAALEAFARKYVAHDVGHVVKSLAYFSDAESAPFPTGLTPEHWARIRRDFESWVRAL
jgi:hypothetical protein